MTISNNPAETRNRANAGTTHLSYPLNETLSSSCVLRFMKYSRFNPWDEAEEEETATIRLPLPVTVPENYSFNNGGADLGAMGMLNDSNAAAIRAATSGGGNFADQLKDFFNAGQSAVTDIVKSKNFHAGIAAGAIGLMSGGTDMDKLSTFTGVVTNPHVTITFNGVNLRNINLEWRFSARSLEESQTLKRIFDTIKLQSHPEEVSRGFALNYPDLVYIEFDGKAKEYLPKFDRALISGINITPDSSGGMPLFKSGAPVIYSLQLQATEISIITRNKLKEQLDAEQVGSNR